MATTAPPATERPLCVDLDGTLVKSDTLVDSLLLLARVMSPYSQRNHERVFTDQSQIHPRDLDEAANQKAGGDQEDG